VLACAGVTRDVSIHDQLSTVTENRSDTAGSRTVEEAEGTVDVGGTVVVTAA